MSQLEVALVEQSGVLSTGQAAALTSPAKVRYQLATGRWSRICRGVVVTHAGELTREQQLWVAVLAAGPGALLGGLTAATESGLRGFPAEPLYVLLPAARTAPDLRRRLPSGMPGVVVRRTTVLPDEHIQVGRPTRTTAPRAVIDAAQWAHGEEPARAVIAAACEQRLVTPEELADALRLLRRARRRYLIRQTINDIATEPE